MKKAMGVCKLNFQNTKIAYIVFFIVIGAQTISDIINIIVSKYAKVDMLNASIGWYVYLYCILMAIFIPASNFKKFMNLNVKKSSYLKGSLITYVLISVGTAIFNSLWYYRLDNALTWISKESRYSFWNLIDVFNWSSSPVIIIFIRQFAFALLVCCTVHWLTTIQSFWYGWLIDAVLAAVISVFTPIPVLRKALIWFFNLIIFNTIPALQIVSCLLIAALLYSLSIISVKQKSI